MLQLVTMHEVEAAEAVEPDQDLDRLAILEQHRVLPPLLPGEEHATSPRARHDLERSAVHVYGMGGIPIGPEPPALRLTEGDLPVDAADVVFLAVDPAHAIEAEVPGDGGIRQPGDRR